MPERTQPDQTVSESMSTDNPEQQLHDRASRGESLSADERMRLEAWYARLDQEEGALLNRAGPPATLTALQRQIETAVAQLATVTQRVQALTAENTTVRREIASLQLLLAQRSTPQPA